MSRLWGAVVGLSLALAGLWAAGLSHSILWLATAAGVISGPYTTYRHDATAMAVFAAAAVACAICLIGVGCALASALRGSGAWSTRLQRNIACVGSVRALVAVSAVQLAAIATLESIEQMAQFGHTLAPLAAFGAPLLIALPVHAICALIVLAASLHVVRAVVHAESELRRVLVALVQRIAVVPSEGVPIRRDIERAIIVKPRPLAFRFANRPPPSIAA